MSAPQGCLGHEEGVGCRRWCCPQNRGCSVGAGGWQAPCLLAWGSAEQKGLANIGVVSFGNTSSLLWCLREQFGQGTPVSSSKGKTHWAWQPNNTGRGLCSCACSGFAATSSRRNSPREGTGRLKVMFLRYTFTLLQVNQRKG